MYAGRSVLSYEVTFCVYGDTIQVEGVVLCLLVALSWVASWYAVYMVTPSKFSWCCCVCLFLYIEFVGDMPCAWWYYQNGGGGIVYAGCTVLSCELISCEYDDPIQMKMVLCVLAALYWVACWFLVYIVTTSKLKWWCCVWWLHCTELRVHKLCVW